MTVPGKSRHSLAQAVISLGQNGFFFDHRLDGANFDLSSGIHKPFIVRNATNEDIDYLVHLEALCWQNLQVSRDELLMRIQRFPTGQWVAVMEDKVVGALYTQLIPSADCLPSGTFKTQGTFHSHEGSVLQLLGVAVLPQYWNLQIASTLRFLAVNIAICTGKSEVVAATRCGGTFTSEESHETAAVSMADPILQFHANAGAKFARILKNYRPDDASNFGHSVMISYSLQLGNVSDDSTLAAISKKTESSSLSVEDLIDCLNSVTQSKYMASEQLLHTPFMQLGLDSLKMMEMRSRLLSFDAVASSGLSIPNTVLFDYPTPFQLLEFLNGNQNERDVSSHVLKKKNIDSFGIDVCGISCRLPNGANTPQRFFEMLCNKENFFKELPVEWKSQCNSQVAGFLDEESSSTFDPDFFGISHEEVLWMDPHQRILLEVIHEALFDAGLLDKLSIVNNKVGVFVGLCNNEWIKTFRDSDVKSPYLGTGTAQSAAANRISYLFGLTGPSVVVDTACSSSLSAVHMAMSSLRQGDCDVAVVASADLLLSPYSLQV